MLTTFYFFSFSLFIYFDRTANIYFVLSILITSLYQFFFYAMILFSSGSIFYVSDNDRRVTALLGNIFKPKNWTRRQYIGNFQRTLPRQIEDMFLKKLVQSRLDAPSMRCPLFMLLVVMNPAVEAELITVFDTVDQYILNIQREIKGKINEI